MSVFFCLLFLLLCIVWNTITFDSGICPVCFWQLYHIKTSNNNLGWTMVLVASRYSLWSVICCTFQLLLIIKLNPKSQNLCILSWKRIDSMVATKVMLLVCRGKTKFGFYWFLVLTSSLICLSFTYAPLILIIACYIVLFFFLSSRSLNIPEFVPMWKVKGVLKQSGLPAQLEKDVFQLQHNKFEHRFSIRGYDPFRSQNETRQVSTTAMMNQCLMHQTKSKSNWPKLVSYMIPKMIWNCY